MSASANTTMPEPAPKSTPGTYSYYPLKQLTILKGLQCRRGIDEGAVMEYVDYLKSDEDTEMIAIEVMRLPDNRIVIIDGVHRHKAYGLAERTQIPTMVREGTMDDAKWAAAAANQSHGIRRTLDDKRRAVVAALRHPNYASGSVSMRDVAKHVGVSHTMVQDTAKKLDLKKKVDDDDEIPDPKAKEFPQEVLDAIAKIGTTNPAAADALLTGAIIKPPDEIIRYSEYEDVYRQALAPLFFGRRLSLMASVEIVEKKPTENSSLRDLISYTRMQGEDIQLAFDNATVLITVSLIDRSKEAATISKLMEI